MRNPDTVRPDDDAATVVSGGTPERLLDKLADAITPTYRVQGELGGGGFGCVYRARHENTGQDVAVKVLRLQESLHASAMASHIARFEREAALCATLNHPNIVRLIDKGHTGRDFYYAIYELVPGETLRRRLRRGALSVEQTAEVMGQVLDALASAHKAGVVHRDIKPENIMVVDTGTSLHAKVLDFGISTITVEARDTAFHAVTRSHELLGTPKYCAPEQLRGETPTPVTDIYAWGLVFIECMTGQAAVVGTTLAELYHQHLSPVEVPLPRVVIGHPLGDFLRRVLQKDPAERAQDTAALFHEFRRLPLADLVGEVASAPTDAQADDQTPATASSLIAELSIARRHVTVIALTLRLRPTSGEVPEPDLLDPILRDQLRLCRSALTRYGGAVSREIGDVFVTTFGYPAASDTDARRAVRTVLELAEDVRRRSKRLQSTHGLELQLRSGIHSGPITVTPGEMPVGITTARALDLAVAAPANTILVTPEARRLLEPLAEIEAGGLVAVSGAAAPVQTARLIGERRAEALAFGPGRTLENVFVGRKTELDQLRAHLAASQLYRTSSAALIVGEAGVGKSRLLIELLRSPQLRSCSMLELRCLAEQRNIALSPVMPVLRGLLGQRDAPDRIELAVMVEALSAYGLDAARLVPILCAWLGMPLPEGYDEVQLAPTRQRELLLEALVTILCQPPDGGPVLLLFEDLHWSDPTTLELIGSLLRAESEARPFILASARPEFDAPWESGRLMTLSLDRLSPEDAAQLAARLWTGAEKATPEVLAAIAARSDGIPLFVAELTRMVSERGSEIVAGDAIPITLRDLLNGRLDQLGEARAVAQIASALGREFDGAILKAAAEGDEQRVDSAIEKLTAANLVYRRRRVAGSAYVFRHALIQEAAYESMPAEVRRHIHQGLAAVLEAHFRDSPAGSDAALARHYAGAGDYETAMQRGTQAAQASINISSNAEAIAQAEQVATWLPKLPHTARVSAELRLSGIKVLALMSMEGWASERVRDLAEASRTLLPQSNTHEHTVSTLFALFLHYHVASKRTDCRRVVDELVDFADRIQDASLQAVAAMTKGVDYHAGGRFLEAETWLEKGRNLYDPERDRHHAAIFGMDCYVWATAQLAWVQWGMGRTTRSFELAEEAIDWARKVQHIPSLALGLLYITQIHQMNGDRDAVRARSSELLETAGTFGLPAYEAYGAALAAWASRDLEGIEQIIGTLKSLNCNLILTFYGSFLSDIEAEAGRLPEAIAQVERWLEACGELDEHVYEPELLRRRGLFEMHLDEPDVEHARRALQTARSLAREQGMYLFEAAALRDLTRLFGASDEWRERLVEINRTYSDVTLE